MTEREGRDGREMTERESHRQRYEHQTSSTDRERPTERREVGEIERERTEIVETRDGDRRDGGEKGRH